VLLENSNENVNFFSMQMCRTINQDINSTKDFTEAVVNIVGEPENLQQAIILNEALKNTKQPHSQNTQRQQYGTKVCFRA